MKLLRYATTSAWDILVIPLILLIHLLWGENLRTEGLSVCTDLKPDSWPRRTWFAKWGGITLGHAIMFGRLPPRSTVVHELVHEKQYEGAMIKSLIVGLLVLLVTGKIWLSYVIWALGWLLYLCSNWLVALMRGLPVYRGSAHEEHAYAVGDEYEHTDRQEHNS